MFECGFKRKATRGWPFFFYQRLAFQQMAGPFGRAWKRVPGRLERQGSTCERDSFFQCGKNARVEFCCREPGETFVTKSHFLTL